MSEPDNDRLFPPYNHTRGDSELEPCQECQQILVETEGSFGLIEHYHDEALVAITKMRGHMEVFAKRRKLKLDVANLSLTDMVSTVNVWKAVRQ